MKKVTLFIAISVDGYLADRHGKVDWLAGHDPAVDSMGSYHEFIREIDTVVLGWNTYHQIVTELSPGEWAYTGQISYVVTHRQLPDTEKIRFVNQNVCELVRQLKQGCGKGIWICGGANVVQPLLRENLIDRFHFTIIPTLLGSGIRLFGETALPIPLRLINSQSYNGMTDLIYEPR